MNAGENPVVILTDSLSGALYAHVAPAEGGTHEDSGRLAKIMAKEIDGMGYRRAILRSDNEPSITAFVRLLRQHVMCELIPKTSAEYDAPSNGRAEQAVGALKDMVRTMLTHTQDHVGHTLAATSQVLGWMVLAAASAHRRFRLDEGGASATTRSTGRHAHELPACVGERVF